jgi:hypothetical protein
MKNTTKFFIAVFIIGLVFILLWLGDVVPSGEEQFKKAVKAYELMEFDGVVTNKFIDKDEHNYQKLILKKDSVSKAVVLNIETSGMYDFVEIGDSLKKERESFLVRVVRADLDTMLIMKFIESQ